MAVMMNTRKKISNVLTYYTTQCIMIYTIGVDFIKDSLIDRCIREILLNQCQHRSTLCHYTTALHYTCITIITCCPDKRQVASSTIIP